MYRFTKSPEEILLIATGEVIPKGHRLWALYEGWLAEGNTPAPAALPYELHSPQHYQAIRSAAWGWMTAYVVDRRYDSVETCVGYYNSSVERYRLEARAMVAWRDAVNLALEQLVTNPPAGIETWEQVQELLPQPEIFHWPSEVSLPLGTGESAVLK
ncbi:hypothetical protein [Stenotrophomonas indicatrix]|uniref:hypothetical protein n=1 Tax=Stenotrophomonas indicatrix TaxID=2045451 RepID=UPI001CBF368E|nr:hypothetical protein [Stenotrophomonas indicatrix]